MISHTSSLMNSSLKLDNYQSNSILSTTSEHYPCQAQSLQITPLLTNSSKKIKLSMLCR